MSGGILSGASFFVSIVHRPWPELTRDQGIQFIRYAQIWGALVLLTGAGVIWCVGWWKVKREDYHVAILFTLGILHGGISLLYLAHPQDPRLWTLLDPVMTLADSLLYLAWTFSAILVERPRSR